MGINQIKISVIIPMYNVAKVIHRAVQSLVNQTLTGFEVIFIDDCSKDDTIKVLNGLLENNKNFTFKIVSHEQNRGVAAARNTGLEHASGEFIYYVDADDYIDSTTLETLYTQAISKNADIVGCEWFLTFAQKERHVSQADCTTGDELFVKMANGVVRWNLWLFLVKRSLYQEYNIRFIERMNMGEDMMVMMKLALQAHRVAMLHVPLYHYIQTNTNSLTKNFQAYQNQVTANAMEIERYLIEIGRGDMKESLLQLKLSLKLPLLISNKQADYDTWEKWFPETNSAVNANRNLPWRTRFIQQCASKKQYWVLRLYYFLVVKLFYGIIYR